MLDESELLGYRLRLEEWEGEQEERKHTFTITDGGTTPKAGSRAASKTKVRVQARLNVVPLSMHEAV